MTRLSIDVLRSRLSYDEATGQFVRKVTAGGQVAGSVAGTIKSAGHVEISVGGHVCKAHRLAWLYVYGEWPKGVIDHINGDRKDNRIVNLRDVSNAINLQNQRRAQRNSTTGVLGVSIDKATGRYRAQIQIAGAGKSLGRYASKDEARRAYINAKRRLHEGCTI